MFLRDDYMLALSRQITALKNSGDWDAAIDVCLEFQRRMWESEVLCGPDDWCRLAYILQQAGRFDEAENEFRKLLAQLPALARKFSHLDEPDVFVGKPGKEEMYKQMIKIWRPLYKEKWRLTKEREERRLARLAKIDKD